MHRALQLFAVSTLGALAAGCSHVSPQPQPAALAPQPGADAPLEYDDQAMARVDDADGGTSSAPPGPAVYRRVAAGTSHTCALHPTGRVFCWGSNRLGQLGQGQVPDPDEAADDSHWPPTLVPRVYDAIGVAAAGDTTCAVRASGTVACWGAQSWFQVMDVELLKDAVAVTVSATHGCALTSSGGAACWPHASPFATYIPGVHDLRGLAMTDHLACSVDAGGLVACWEPPDTSPEAVGAAAALRAVIPRPLTFAGLGPAVSIGARGDRACVSDAAGRLSCWIFEWGAHLSTRPPRDDRWFVSPRVEVYELAEAPREIVLTPHGACTLGGPRFPWLDCWDWDAGRDPRRLERLERLEGVESLAVGDGHACAALPAGGIECWGANGERQLGVDEPRRTARAVEAIPDAVSVAFEGPKGCALRRTGEVWCWDAQQRTAPSPVPGLRAGVQFAMGGDQACAVLRGGRVACWGARPDYGDRAEPMVRYGDGSRPQVIAGVTGAVEVAVAPAAACARLAGGTLRCWYAAPSASSLEQVEDLVSIALSYSLWLGARRDGELVCPRFGCDHGPGTPARSLGGLDVERVSLSALASAANPFSVCIVRRAKTAACFARFPHEPRELGEAVQVAAGATTCLLRPSGEVACLGANRNGQVGDGTTERRDAPVPVAGLPSASAVATSSWQSCAVARGGQLWCWGGDTSADAEPRPVQVRGLPEP